MKSVAISLMQAEAKIEYDASQTSEVSCSFCQKESGDLRFHRSLDVVLVLPDAKRFSSLVAILTFLTISSVQEHLIETIEDVGFEGQLLNTPDRSTISLQVTLYPEFLFKPWLKRLRSLDYRDSVKEFCI